jgi:ABC-type amino acid transport substrate-binding protein
MIARCSRFSYLVFAKSAQQTILLEKFNTTLAAMRQDDTYLELLKNCCIKKYQARWS